MAPEPPTKCSTCGDPATNKCGACKTAYYCTKDCQNKDWSKHKVHCKDPFEKPLALAADLIQAAWLNFRENTWDTPIERVEVKEDELITYDGDQWAKSGQFVKFPNDLMPNDSVKAGVLCNMMCNEPLAYLYNFISILISALPIEIHEVAVKLKKPPRKNTAVHPGGFRQPNWPDYSHFLLRLTSKKSGKMWYIDITGGQYGLCQSFWRVKEFDQRYVDTIQGVSLFGKNKAYIKACSKANATMHLIYGSSLDAAAVLDQAMHRWIKENGITCYGIISANEMEHSIHKEKLLSTLDTALKEFVAKADYSNDIRAARQGPGDTPCFYASSSPPRPSAEC
ncbi:uncharacterized protein K460DRAFT_386407 [Cucurbitaria berberidis CBS 394.84]|uniref:MYND-type domain-containing protein n=1 Tax=Cucurbitaria berberidis CBS 394.84 TaxID=1168544 RepID=A0A9P4GI69_9PLEO|nr:uncharacterized protein K460DRAFT_386407 [Cucurbitaria berberidis CBS 394.84]KAF1846045.1 hypothetical protein K460DRAFT_386407 [Cucurbitaria berberidis CBS 394.84]